MQKLNESILLTTVTRREALTTIGAILLSAALSACERKYIRPGKFVDMGEVKDLLVDKQHLPDQSLLVYRDEQGWSVLSTQCTYDGCQLTFQEQNLYCSCCRSVFDHRGNVLRGPTKMALPWFEISYEAKHLYANTNKIVGSQYRFSDPTLEEAIKQYLATYPDALKSHGVLIPDILKGSGDGEPGVMFEQQERENLDVYHQLPSSPESKN